VASFPQVSPPNPLYTSPLPYRFYMRRPFQSSRLYTLIHVCCLYTCIEVATDGLLFTDIVCHRLIRLWIHTDMLCTTGNWLIDSILVDTDKRMWSYLLQKFCNLSMLLS
jgi:hypothetical protein